ncbi:MAG TPA: acetylxylan esterase [Chthoniobacteraceae bacterium]|jgi:cephalosporin-C deacetylase-like acetyl esterase|nr:acetylxylan esterase [Chthoniobacteraceae bacterium]
MKHLLVLTVLLLTTIGGLRAAEDLTVLPPTVDGVAPTALLDTQLKKFAYAALDQREAEYEKIKTPDDVAAWQKRRRADFLAAIGGLPERTPLNARVMGSRDFGEYRVDKILFESQPGFLVSGLLYLPKGDGPHPAVLMPCGHTNIAKAGELYQRASISLVRAGLAVFCYDPLGQGERRHYRQPDGTLEFDSSVGEHQLMGIAGAPLGAGVQRAMIWDAMRGLDYLQSRPEIRGDRLGCTGVSGGGMMTSYLMALDDRIAAAAPACYLTGYRRLLETIGPQDFEQNLFGQLAAGLDHADYVIMSAPRPVLMMVATRDFFDIQGAWNVFRQAKRCYGRLGLAERVELIEADTKHDLAIDMREASARWFRRWLLGKDDAWKEPAGLEVLPEKEALCTPEGDVLRQPGARSFFELNAAMAAPLVAERQRFWKENPLPAGLAKVRELARIRPLAEIPAVTATVGETIQRGPVRIEKMILRNAEGTVIPALLFRSAKPGAVTRLYVHGVGTAADAGPQGKLETMALAGETVLAADVRGLGEMEGRKSPPSLQALSEPNWKSASLASLLGRSIVGLRSEDILACARFASEMWAAGGPIQLTGIGEAGVPALHAVALEPQLFAGARIERTLESWHDLVRSSHSKNQQINTVNGALRFYDLPNLVSALPAGKLVIHEPVDAMGAVRPKTADAGVPADPAEFAHARITEAWAAYADRLTFGRGQTLALLDDGCTMSRPEWKAVIDGVPKVRVTYDAVDGDDDPKHEGKGYHGSTIGIPSSVNYAGKRGVAYNDQLAIVRSLECCHCKLADSVSLARALQWVIDHHAEHRITTVNLAPVDDLEHGEPVPTEIDTKLAELRALGIWVSAPAGNHNFTKGISWPAAQPNCFAIGAVKPGADLIILDRSEKVDLLVPASATSSSNAIVCGAAMILREAIEKSQYDWKADGPNIAEAMMAIFRKTGVAVEDPGPKRNYRRLDLMAALDHVMKPVPKP